MNERAPLSPERRRRRRGPSGKPPGSAAAVIAAARPAIDPGKPADEPLSEAEVAEMRVHLRFLKEHRKILALKVNAAEDLLLNGVREPTHRGVCQHLLDKVERSRVELAVQRLDLAARLRLLEGLIRFSPDVTYLLLYLESLKDAARPDAMPALAAALRRIDFEKVSVAQMRRVLDLIVELTGERDRPQLLFSLLSSSTFQKAFDASAERLPEGLASIVVPLRAAHAVIVRGAPNPFDVEALARGTGMLLASHERVLLAHPPAVRRRLLETGLALVTEASAPHAAGLRALLESFPPAERGGEAGTLGLFRWLVARGLEREARALAVAAAKEGVEVPRAWLAALDGPRFGGVAVERLPTREPDRAPREIFTTGILLSRWAPVWLRLGTPADVERYARTAELQSSLVVPGVVSIVAHGVGEHGEPFLATPRHGRSASEVVLGKRGLAPGVALAVALEANAILAALGAAGVRLPDARYRRFAVDGQGRLWLRDLVDAERAADAARANAGLARELCLDVLARAERLLVPASVIEGLRAAEDALAIARLLRELG